MPMGIPIARPRFLLRLEDGPGDEETVDVLVVLVLVLVKVCLKIVGVGGRDKVGSAVDLCVSSAKGLLMMMLRTIEN